MSDVIQKSLHGAPSADELDSLSSDVTIVVFEDDDLSPPLRPDKTPLRVAPSPSAASVGRAAADDSRDRMTLPVGFASPQGPLLTGLDIVAALLAAVMIIGPLFAAFVGRMTS